MLFKAVFAATTLGACIVVCLSASTLPRSAFRLCFFAQSVCRMCLCRFFHPRLALASAPFARSVSERTGALSIRRLEGEIRECPAGLTQSTYSLRQRAWCSAHRPPLSTQNPSPFSWSVDSASWRRVRPHIPHGLDRPTAVAAAQSRPHTVMSAPGSSRKEDCRSFSPPSQSEPPRVAARVGRNRNVDLTIGTTLGGVSHGA